MKIAPGKYVSLIILHKISCAKVVSVSTNHRLPLIWSGEAVEYFEQIMAVISEM